MQACARGDDISMYVAAVSAINSGIFEIESIAEVICSILKFDYPAAYIQILGRYDLTYSLKNVTHCRYICAVDKFIEYVWLKDTITILSEDIISIMDKYNKEKIG